MTTLKDMTFEDLPSNWADMPLTDPALAADVVDLFLGDRDRHADSLMLLLCDEDHRLVQPVMIDGMEWRSSAQEVAESTAFLGHLGEVPSMIAAISSARPFTLPISHRWRQALLRTVPGLLHVYTANPGLQPRRIGGCAQADLAS